MEIVEHRIPFSLPFARLYMEEFEKVSSFFDYDPGRDEDYFVRMRELRDSPHVDRFRLVEALADYNRRVGNERALPQLDRLLRPEAVVVIGGQQPGLLTGPLYTVYKVLTILAVAKREEERLKVPVIPVYWIAGEDHDWDEVGHVYLPHGEGIEKLRLAHPGNERASISHVHLSSDALSRFVESFFSYHPITLHTAGVKKKLLQAAEESKTLSHFFARLLVTLFPDEGLILFDSADSVFRRLEGEMFRRFLSSPELLSDPLERSKEKVRELGLKPQIESEKDSAHLFIYENGGRILLEQDGEEYRSKRIKRGWKREELLRLTEEEPERFSCNVVTRPLMQEYLFPVLSFIAGPGEISYWGLLREVFHAFQLKMPIIIPRMGMTLVERTVHKLYERMGLEFRDFLLRPEEALSDWVKKQDQLGLEDRIRGLSEEIDRLYQPILKDLFQVDAGLGRFGEKNLAILMKQVERLKRRIEQTLIVKDQELFRQFMVAKQLLLPNDHPQERVFTPFTFINRYGWEWWESFRRLPFAPNSLHKEVRL